MRCFSSAVTGDRRESIYKQSPLTSSVVVCNDATILKVGPRCNLNSRLAPAHARAPRSPNTNARLEFNHTSVVTMPLSVWNEWVMRRVWLLRFWRLAAYFRMRAKKRERERGMRWWGARLEARGMSSSLCASADGIKRAEKAPCTLSLSLKRVKSRAEYPKYIRTSEDLTRRFKEEEKKNVYDVHK